MFRCSRRALVALAVSISAAAPLAAEPILINNGLAPPNPENVIDGVQGSGNLFSTELLYVVRNQGCTELSGPCSEPGGPTTVEIAPNAEIGGAIDVYESSTLAFTGGVQYGPLQLYDSAVLTGSSALGLVEIQAYENSSLFIDEGGYMHGLDLFDSTMAEITGYFGYSGAFTHGFSSLAILGGGEVLGASDSSSVELLGGSSNYMDVYGSSSITANAFYIVSEKVDVADQSALQINDGGRFNRMLVQDTSVVTIAGHDFEVCDGSSSQAICAPVGLGLLSEQTGTLRGTSFSGETITVYDFRHGGYSDANGTYTGQIWLVPEPSTGLLLALGLAGLASGRRGRS